MSAVDVEFDEILAQVMLFMLSGVILAVKEKTSKKCNDIM